MRGAGRPAALALALGLALASPSTGGAQTLRVVDPDRMFADSQLGRTVLSELREAEQALERDNQDIADRLAAEERALTDLRATLSPEEFRIRADDFDRRVELIRTERARLSQDLARRYDSEIQRFLQTALPILQQMMADEGIAALLRPEAVLLGGEEIDATERAIERLNAATAAEPD